MTEEEKQKIKDYAKNQGLPEDWVRQEWEKKEAADVIRQREEERLRVDVADRAVLEGQVDVLRALSNSDAISDESLRADIRAYLSSGLENKRPYKAIEENEDLFKRLSVDVKKSLNNIDRRSDTYDALKWIADMVEYLKEAPKSYKPYYIAGGGRTTAGGGVSGGYWGGTLPPGTSWESYLAMYTPQKVLLYKEGTPQYEKAIGSVKENAELFKQSATRLATYLQKAQTGGSVTEAPKLSSEISAARESGGLAANKGRYMRQYVQFPSEGTKKATQRATSPYIQTTKSPSPSRTPASNLYTRVKTGR